MGIVWDRKPGASRPIATSGDSFNSAPAANAALMALVCLDLFEATGKRLWLAKGDALVAACLEAQDPETGILNTRLEPAAERYTIGGGHPFTAGWTARSLGEYASRRRAVDPPFHVRGAPPPGPAK
jgi:hypothetical protein